jgi:hypothetical protein
VVVDAKRALLVFCYASWGGPEVDSRVNISRWSDMVYHDDGSGMENDEEMCKLMGLSVVVEKMFRCRE